MNFIVTLTPSSLNKQRVKSGIHLIVVGKNLGVFDDNYIM